MSSQKESTVRTLTVALLVCLVCSIFVAGAAVALRPTQQENRLLDKQRSILAIAGLGEAGMSANKVKQLFNERIVARLVDLETGKFSDEFDAKTFDPLVAAKDLALSKALPGEQDIASIKRRERYSTVYIVEGQGEGEIDTLILPVRGYGLWSTLYGFMAVKGDLDTVAGFGFYQHGETPGLGGEVDNRSGAASGRARNCSTTTASWPYRSSRAGRPAEPACQSSGRRPGRRDPDQQRCQQPVAVLAGRERLRSIYR